MATNSGVTYVSKLISTVTVYDLDQWVSVLSVSKSGYLYDPHQSIPSVPSVFICMIHTSHWCICMIGVTSVHMFCFINIPHHLW
jgi:hypothetical protein